MPLAPQTLETMSWRLLQQTAALLGLRVVRDERNERNGWTQVGIEFPRTVGEQMEGVSAVELQDPVGQENPTRSPAATCWCSARGARSEA